MQRQRSRWRVAKMTAAFDQMLTRQAAPPPLPHGDETMAAVPRLYHEINEVTGFANGDRFETAAQVRDYFTRENLWEMVGHEQYVHPGTGEDLTPTQAQLDDWASDVIAHRWHCTEAFEA
jgi:hypothetical protein